MIFCIFTQFFSQVLEHLGGILNCGAIIFYKLYLEKTTYNQLH